MHQTKLSLLILTALLTTSLPAYANQPSAAQLETQMPKTNLVAQTATTTDLIGVGATLINNWINPPSRSAQINADAEVKKAKIAADTEIAKEKLRIEAGQSADTTTPLLNQWGVARVNCAPGLVFINGITTDTVCIQPSVAMRAGSYTYDRDRDQLIRIKDSNAVITNNPQVNRATSIVNVQRVRTTQSTTGSSTGEGF